MGTNYFLYRQVKVCDTCGGSSPVAEDVHIGKSSAGWVFLWRGYREGITEQTVPPLVRPADWYEFLAVSVARDGAEIRDEYGKTMPLVDFIAKVVAKRESPNRNSDVTAGGDIARVGLDDIAFYEFS